MLSLTIIIFTFAMTDLGISLEASLLALRGADNLVFAGIIAVRSSSAPTYCYFILSSLQFAVEALTAIIVDGVLVSISKFWQISVH